MSHRLSRALCVPGFVALMCFSTTGLSTEVYKWVDKNGTVHYGDQPSENAEKMDVQPVTTMPFPEAPEDFKAYAPPKKEVDKPLYNVLITAPANDSAFHAPSGDVVMEVSTEPPLKREHQLTYRLDGQVLYQGTERNHVAKNVNRGTHQLHVQITNENGKVVGESTSTFTVHRPSVIKRAGN